VPPNARGLRGAEDPVDCGEDLLRAPEAAEARPEGLQRAEQLLRRVGAGRRNQIVESENVHLVRRLGRGDVAHAGAERAANRRAAARGPREEIDRLRNEIRVIREDVRRGGHQDGGDALRAEVEGPLAVAIGVMQKMTDQTGGIEEGAALLGLFAHQRKHAERAAAQRFRSVENSFNAK
jgi:hypothetical protein